MQKLLDLEGAPIPDPLAHTRQLQSVVDDFMTKVTALLRECQAVLDRFTSRWRRACDS